jgi:transcriptional regulator with XRE-family HTH domain
MDQYETLFAQLLGEKIRELRKEKGWSQWELGLRIGIHHNNVSELELGKSQPKSYTLFQLYHNLPLDVDQIFHEAKEKIDILKKNEGEI